MPQDFDILLRLFCYMQRDNISIYIRAPKNYHDHYPINYYWQFDLVGRIIQVGFIDSWSVGRQNCYVMKSDTWSTDFYWNVNVNYPTGIIEGINNTEVSITGSIEDFRQDMLYAKMLVD